MRSHFEIVNQDEELLTESGKLRTWWQDTPGKAPPDLPADNGGDPPIVPAYEASCIILPAIRN